MRKEDQKVTEQTIAQGPVASQEFIKELGTNGGGFFNPKLGASCKHAAGYVTVGAAYKLTGKLTGVAAYSIGNANASQGNHFFYFELGYNFN